MYLVRANPRTTGETLAALKVFHPPDRREFRDEWIYRDGEFIKPRRIRAALEKQTPFGRVVAGRHLGRREWETSGRFRRAGAMSRIHSRVGPRAPHDYIGDEDDAAPQLQIRPDGEETEDLLEQVIRTVERILFATSSTATCRRTTSWSGKGG